MSLRVLYDTIGCCNFDIMQERCEGKWIMVLTLEQRLYTCEELRNVQIADPTKAKKGYTTAKAKTTEV
nr:hypothetical protein [Tanacetum cinerariifolium]